MGKKYVIDESTLTNIANAIRNQTGTEDAIAVKDFANKISECGYSISSDELIRVVFHDVSLEPGGYGLITGPIFDENGNLIAHWGKDLIFEEPYYLSSWNYYTIEGDHPFGFNGSEMTIEQTSYDDDSYMLINYGYGQAYVVQFYGSQIEINVAIDPIRWA